MLKYSRYSILRSGAKKTLSTVSCIAVLAGCSIGQSGAFSGPVELGQADQPKCEAEANSGDISKPIGYDDTPLLPGEKWKVHDAARTYPEIVGASVVSVPPPSDAKVLFSGNDMSAWQEKTGGLPRWRLNEGVGTIPGPLGIDGKPRKKKIYTIETKEAFGDVQLHVEWKAPEDKPSNSQGRGNSGIIFMGRYEIQVLDSHCNDTYADGQAAAMYGWKPPLVNATAPTAEWQSYDIVFEAPRWDLNGELKKKARATVFHNGVVVHHAQPFLGKTVFKSIADYSEVHERKAPLVIQDHESPVSFRNIWIRELNLKSNN